MTLPDKCAGKSGRKCEVSPESVTLASPTSTQAGHFEHGEQVLHACPLFRAPSVDEREGEEDRDADHLFDPQCHRHELFEIQQERAGQRRERSRNGDEHDRPAVKERPERPVRLAHVDVESAGLRQHGAELGERQRAAEDEQSGERPDAEDQARLGHVSGDEARDDEDSRADDGADEQGGAVDERASLRGRSAMCDKNTAQGSELVKQWNAS